MDNTHKYDGLQHRLNPVALLARILAVKGAFYPGAFIPFINPKDGVTKVGSGYYDMYTDGLTFKSDEAGDLIEEFEKQELNFTIGDRGTPLRKWDKTSGMSAFMTYYFMPVFLKTSAGKLELPIATISIKGKKTIIETPLTGRRGSVKELISVNDYEISLHGVIVGADGNYPEAEIKKFSDLYELNESITLISGLSDLVLKPDDKIVIKSIDYPEVGHVENAQIISMTAVTDSSIDLIIK